VGLVERPWNWLGLVKEQSKLVLPYPCGRDARTPRIAVYVVS
jgi:hypothetical protein